MATLTEALEAQAEFEAKLPDFDRHRLKVWIVTNNERGNLESAAPDVDKRAWTWNGCTNEQCTHLRHDPYMRGDYLFFSGRQIGQIISDGNLIDIYQIPNGRIFGYKWRKTEIGFAPDITLIFEFDTGELRKIAKLANPKARS